VSDRLFANGDLCLLIDNKERQYLITLEDGGSFQYHNGEVSHSDIIGQPDGSVLRSSRGGRLVALRPRMADYILKMRRGAQVVYPKDLGAILVWGDIGPGMTVLEAGTGSGALTMALLRAVGAAGRVVSVERRQDHADHARVTVERFFGALPANLDLRVGEVEDHVEEVAPDRLVLDLPEPFAVVPAAAAGMPPGGGWVSYVPTVPQVQQTADALQRAGCFFAIRHFEVMRREWNVEGRSVRPNHQMVGHTGFITVARKTMPLRSNHSR
jgi:tRNA (adenine57-N1/adenine58-N1)-methyltransferase